TLKQEKEGVDGKLAGLLTASKDLDNLIKSQRSDKNKEGLRYTAVPPPPAQLYLSPKNDLFWTGLRECADDTVTDYSRPSPTVESISEDDQNRNPSVSENLASPITPKPFIKKRVKNNFTPKTVAHKPYRPLKRPVRTNMNDARPNRTFFNKQAHSYANRPVNRTSAVRSPYRALWVSTVKMKCPPVNKKISTGSRNFPTANRKFPTASRKFPTCSTKSSTADMEKKGKVVKPSACWFWRPSQNLSNKGPKNNSVSVMFKKYTYIDTQGRLNGCSRHMTGNISYLSDYEPFDGGFMSFGQGGCKITGKGTIKTGKLEFKNVYFVKDLKDFKFLDDANILLRTPRQHNMYSIDLNNIVPHRDLTCLVAKAFADECMLWHRTLGHLNFKTMNELVRHNLVRGLPTKCFENDHTCTVCLNGKQHKASYNLGKFKEKGDECYFIGYSMSSKAVRVFNKRTMRVEENLHVEFLENKAIEKGSGPNWLFDFESLTKSINYVPVDAGTIYTNLSSTKDAARQEVKKDVSSLRYIALPNWAHDVLLEFSSTDQMETLTVETPIPTVSSPVPTAYSTDSQEPSSDARLISKRVANQKETPSLDNILSLTNRFENILGVEPKKIYDALQDPSWVEAMQKELLQFKIQNVWTLVDCPKGVRPIGTKWVLKYKKDERGIVIRNKARLVAQGHTPEEGIDYDEVFSPVARIEAIRLFLAYASFMGFTVYQMDSKSTFLYGTIDEEVYVMQPPGFQDLEFPAKVYKVEKAMYGLHQAPRAWYGTLSKYLLKNGFQRGTIDQTLFIRKQREDFIFVQVYVDDIIFGSLNPQLCREFEAIMHEKFQMSAMGELNFFLGLQFLQKEDVIFLSQDKHQVTPKECHLHAVKRIFRYLKGHPKLGLWFPKESLFNLVAYSDSDYGGSTQDRKFTTRGCQFLDRRLILWQCKKQTIVATSTTKAEYVAAASYCGQVLWIQN
nr:putative ribonuclease H-like domain-containing protein [Tanacetum cinerariifolium]